MPPARPKPEDFAQRAFARIPSPISRPQPNKLQLTQLSLISRSELDRAGIFRFPYLLSRNHHHGNLARVTADRAEVLEEELAGFEKVWYKHKKAV